MIRHRPPAAVTGADIQARWNAEGAALPREVRQQFLDAVWEGKSIGDAQRMAGISFEAALGIMGANIDPGRATLRRIAA